MIIGFGSMSEANMERVHQNKFQQNAYLNLKLTYKRKIDLDLVAILARAYIVPHTIMT